MFKHNKFEYLKYINQAGIFDCDKVTENIERNRDDASSPKNIIWREK